MLRQRNLDISNTVIDPYNNRRIIETAQVDGLLSVTILCVKFLIKDQEVRLYY